ncbi:MAG: hypothetical protein ACK5OW_00350 [bacterium]|jgi:hypothetical protein
MRELIKKILKEARVPREERVELYKDDNIIVVVPLTHKALQKYANQCQWCINSDLGEWEDYHKGMHAIIIQRNPKKDKIGITGHRVAEEILLMGRWDEGGYTFKDVCDILGYQFKNETDMGDYYVTVTNDINNFATNIVYYSPENGIYDQEDNFLWNFHYEISDIPNVTPNVVHIMDDYLWRSSSLKESEDGFDWAKELIDADGINTEVLNYLKTNYPKKTESTPYFGLKSFIIIDDKPYYFDYSSKKLILNKIYWEIEDEFNHVVKSVLRRTIRHYINSLI